MSLMRDYSGPEYKGLYEEILLDYHYRFPKFHPIPYTTRHEKINPNTTIRKGH